MKKRTYAIVGTFSMKKEVQKGITVFNYRSEENTFELIGNFYSDMNVGQQCFNKKKEVCYLTDETKDGHNRIGGGGYVRAVKLDQTTGVPQMINEKESMGTQPSYITIDYTGKYLLIPHHGSDSYVTKIVKEQGVYRNIVMTDDCGITLMKINDDGSLGDICDIAEIETTSKHIFSHLHSCSMDPSGSIYLICDKGQNKLYTFKIDYEREKLILLKEYQLEEGSSPRYSLFHQTQDIFYQNNERTLLLNVFLYHASDGAMKLIKQIPLVREQTIVDNWQEEGPSDILLHPNGKWIYVSIRTINIIAYLEIGSDGIPILIQNVDCQGKNPRGLGISEDGKILFVTNRDTDNIAMFKIEPNGRLKFEDENLKTNLPGNIHFITEG